MNVTFTKRLADLMALTMILILAACGGAEQPTETQAAITETPEPTAQATGAPEPGETQAAATATPEAT